MLSVPQVPQLPIIRGILALFLAFIRLFHSDLTASREYLEVPEPKENGPLSVEPPSIAIMSGLFFIPVFKAFKSKPNPRTPEGTKTFVDFIFSNLFIIFN